MNWRSEDRVSRLDRRIIKDDRRIFNDDRRNFKDDRRIFKDDGPSIRRFRLPAKNWEEFINTFGEFMSDIFF